MDAAGSCQSAGTLITGTYTEPVCSIPSDPARSSAYIASFDTNITSGYNACGALSQQLFGECMAIDQTYTALMQSVASIHCTQLSNAELNVLNFIIQRTARFAKRSEFIPLRHFTVGIFDRNGALITARASSDKHSVLRGINGLVEKGYITSRSRPQGSNQYTLLVESMITIEREIMGHLKQPRKKAVVWNHTNDGVESHQSLVGNHTNISNGLESNGLDEVTDASLFSSAAIKQGHEKSKAAAYKKQQKARLSLSRNNTVTMWRSFLQGSFPKSAAPATLSDKHWGQLKAQSKMVEPEEFYDLMKWSVDNWLHLGRTKLQWVANMGALPDLGLWCVLFKHFQKEYLAGSIYDADREATAGPTGNATEDDLAEARQELESAQRAVQEAVELATHYKRRLVEGKSRRTRKRRAVEAVADELPEWEDDDE